MSGLCGLLCVQDEFLPQSLIWAHRGSARNHPRHLTLTTTCNFNFPSAHPTALQIFLPTEGAAVFDPGHAGPDRGAHYDDGDTSAAAAAATLLLWRRSAATCRCCEGVLYSSCGNRLGLYLSGRCWPCVRPKVNTYLSEEHLDLVLLETSDRFCAGRCRNWLKFLNV